MIDRIIRALGALNIGTYNISETRSESVEAFYIRRRLDMKRRTELTDYAVTVYRPFERDGRACLGSSDAPLYPDMDDGEIRAALEAAYRAAALVANPSYELYAGGHEAFVPSKSGFASASLDENLRAMAEALFAADTCEDAFLNSAEFFAIKSAQRVVNSRGVDVSWESREVKGEYVVQCVAPQDVETHHIFRCLEPDADSLRREAAEAIERTRDRANASEPPHTGDYAVLLSDGQVGTLLDYYLARSNASVIYQRYSDWKVGENVQGEASEGDALNLTLRAVEPYDGEGIPLRDRPLLEGGRLATLHGGARFSSYLGIEPTGDYRCMRADIGSTPLDALKGQPHLYVATFSDFQCDALTGHFGGEIRLGYLYDGNETKLVTGGSINGNLQQLQGRLTFSAERQKTASFEGPKAVLIPGVAVAGRGR